MKKGEEIGLGDQPNAMSQEGDGLPHRGGALVVISCQLVRTSCSRELSGCSMSLGRPIYGHFESFVSAERSEEGSGL